VKCEGGASGLGLACRSRYTRNVGSFVMRGVSILLLVLLSGTPALASVCAALCLPGTSHHAAEVAAPAVGPHVHGGEAAAPTSHHHEVVAVEAEHSERGEAARLGASSERLRGPHECCPDAARSAAMAAAPRTHVGAALLSSAPGETTALYARVSAQPLIAVGSGTALSPPPPVRSVLVLRV
jgi:hypothetical protein